MSRFAAIVTKLDQVRFTTLLWLNGALATFVVLAHGSVILLHHVGKAQELADQIPALYASVCAALFGLLLSLLGLSVHRARAVVLKTQTILLLILAVGVLYFAGEVIVFGSPPAAKFAWNPALFAFIVGYPVYLVRRVFRARVPTSSDPWLFAPVWVAGGSLVISAVVMWRVFAAGTT